MKNFTFLSSLIFSLICCAVTDWSPETKLVNANCDQITIETSCPSYETETDIEINLFTLINNRKILLANSFRKCRPSNEKYIISDFSISCKGLYYVNVSLSGRKWLNCDPICRESHMSSIWFLGELNCDENMMRDDCKYDRFKNINNQCSATSRRCKSLPHTDQMILSTEKSNNQATRVVTSKRKSIISTFKSKSFTTDSWRNKEMLINVKDLKDIRILLIVMIVVLFVFVFAVSSVIIILLKRNSYSRKASKHWNRVFNGKLYIPTNN